MNAVQEILGYTELHPEVVQKILDLYEKVEGHDMRMTNLTEIIKEFKGLNVPVITKMINDATFKMNSKVEEGT